MLRIQLKAVIEQTNFTRMQVMKKGVGTAVSGKKADI